MSKGLEGPKNVERKLKEKDEEIKMLKEKMNNAILREKELETENEELKERVKSMEDEYEKLFLEANEEQKQAQSNGPQKELATVYYDILSISKAITGIIKGEEPNIQSLWGVSKGDKSMEVEELGGGEFESLKMAVESIRTSICDYYADKYSNECNIK